MQQQQQRFMAQQQQQQQYQEMASAASAYERQGVPGQGHGYERVGGVGVYGMRV